MRNIFRASIRNGRNCIRSVNSGVSESLLWHHAYSGQCTYCGHCAPCPAGIDIAMVNKLYDLAAMQEEVPATVKAHYEGLSANAKDCIACKGCETRCPFDVPVVERMEKAKELFGSL